MRGSGERCRPWEIRDTRDGRRPARLDPGDARRNPRRMSSSDNRDASAAERREAGRRASGSMAGLEAEERARIQRMTPVERMTLALRMGRIAPPDLGDPIDGLLRVRASPDGDPVDIVNFAGPGSAGALAIAHAGFLFAIAFSVGFALAVAFGGGFAAFAFAVLHGGFVRFCWP